MLRSPGAAGYQASPPAAKRQRQRHVPEQRTVSRGRSPSADRNRRATGRESKVVLRRRSDSRQTLRSHAAQNRASHVQDVDGDVELDSSVGGANDSVRRRSSRQPAKTRPRGQVDQDGDDVDSLCSDPDPRAYKPSRRGATARDLHRGKRFEDGDTASRGAPRPTEIANGRPQRKSLKNDEDVDYSYYSEQGGCDTVVSSVKSRGASAGTSKRSGDVGSRVSVVDGSKASRSSTKQANGAHDSSGGTGAKPSQPRCKSPDRNILPADPGEEKSRLGRDRSPSNAAAAAQWAADLLASVRAKKAAAAAAASKVSSDVDSTKRVDASSADNKRTDGARHSENTGTSRTSRLQPRHGDDMDSMSADLSEEESRLGPDDPPPATFANAAPHTNSGRGSDSKFSGGAEVNVTSDGVGIKGIGASGIDFDLVRQTASGVPEADQRLLAAYAAKAKSRDEATGTSNFSGGVDIRFSEKDLAIEGVKGVGASGIDFDLVRRAAGKASAVPSADELPVPVETPKRVTAAKEHGSEYFVAPAGTLCGPEQRFIIQEELGRGEFSSVYRCEDAGVAGMEYAVKFTKQIRRAENKKAIEGTKKEIKLLQDICSQVVEKDPTGARHILSLMFMQAFEHSGHLCVVFELMKCSLRVALKKYTEGRGFPFLPTVRSLSNQIMIALRALQRVEVLHCDVKPENILLSRDRKTIKLSDFGCARKLDDCERVEYLQSAKYRAPEIITGQPYSFQMDTWSAGATLFELATGETLFNGQSNGAVIHEILKVCGAFPIHVTVGRFSSKYFAEDTGDFIGENTLLKPAVLPMQHFANPTRPISLLLEQALREPSRGVDPKRHQELVGHFGDLLKKCLILEPSLRATADDALGCRFFASSSTLV